MMFASLSWILCDMDATLVVLNSTNVTYASRSSALLYDGSKATQKIFGVAECSNAFSGKHGGKTVMKWKVKWLILIKLRTIGIDSIKRLNFWDP